jgi:hypothetical protein
VFLKYERAGGVAEVVDLQLRKHEFLSSSLSSAKKERKRKAERERGREKRRGKERINAFNF